MIHSLWVIKVAGKRQPFTQAQQSEIREALLMAKTKQEYRRLAILLAMATCNRSLFEIAREFGVSESMVHHLAHAYRKDGLVGIFARPKGGNHRNMSLAEEAELLGAFRHRLEKGEPVAVSEIHCAYERKLGRPVSKSVVYYVLARHGWPRKVESGQEPDIMDQ